MTGSTGNATTELELRAGVAEVRLSLAESRLAMARLREDVLARLDALTLAVTDLRSAIQEHTHRQDP